MMNGLKTEAVAVPAGFGRDDGKAFLITEKPSVAAERWGLRMTMLLQGTKERIPDETRAMGMVGIAQVGLNIFLRAPIDPDKLIPLLDELLTCVQMIRDASRPDIATPLLDSDIMEIKTRMWLRGEVLRVHTGFSPYDALSRLLSAALEPPSPSPAGSPTM